MSFLKNLFTKSATKTAAKTIDTGSAVKDSSMTLASNVPAQYLPLWNLYKQRQLLEVKLNGTSRLYQSMIIALDIERGLLWLDDLFPQQLLVEVGDEITLRHHRNGEHLVIRANVVALGANFGATGLAIMLPDNATYTPRRSAPRFSVNNDSPLMVKIRTLGQEPCYGTLQDISTGGIRVNVAGNLLGQLRHGAILPLCEVVLDDGFQLRCRAKVCAFRMNRSPYRNTQISIEFIDLADNKRAELNHFLRQMLNEQASAECAA